MKIRWTTPATEELAAAYEYIAAENQSAAQRLTNEIWEAVDMLGRYPKAGRRGRVVGTRELVVGGTPFVIAYRIEKNELQVLAVLHAARKLPDEL
jgi:toxin ParE1/3/4